MKAVALAALALAGCAPRAGPPDAGGSAAIGNVTGSPSASSPGPSNDVGMTSPNDPLRTCDGSRANSLLGRGVDAATRAEAMRLVGATSTRVIPPGAMVTMDYRGDRLNIDTDATNRASRFHCG